MSAQTRMSIRLRRLRKKVPAVARVPDTVLVPVIEALTPPPPRRNPSLPVFLAGWFSGVFCLLGLGLLGLAFAP